MPVDGRWSSDEGKKSHSFVYGPPFPPSPPQPLRLLRTASSLLAKKGLRSLTPYSQILKLFFSSSRTQSLFMWHFPKRKGSPDDRKSRLLLLLLLLHASLFVHCRQFEASSPFSVFFTWQPLKNILPSCSLLCKRFAIHL